MPGRCASPFHKMSSSVRPRSSGCSWVWANQPGRTRAPSRAVPVCRTAAIASSSTGRGSGARSVVGLRVASARRQEPEEVALAGPVRAENCDPVAVPDLEVERLHQPGQLELLADDGPLAGARAAQPHLHVLLLRDLLRGPGLLELGEPRDSSLVTAGHAVVVRRLLPKGGDERLELGVLLVPSPAKLLEPGEPVAPGVVVAR